MWAVLLSGWCMQQGLRLSQSGNKKARMKKNDIPDLF